MELFKLPRELGKTPEEELVQVGVGRFGPYIRYGDKYVSIKRDDPYTITLERALEVIAEKKTADANKIIKTFKKQNISILNGRYGPYVTDGGKNVRVPKGRKPQTLTLEECEKIIADAPQKKTRRKGKKAATGKRSPARKTSANKRRMSG